MRIPIFTCLLVLLLSGVASAQLIIDRTPFEADMVKNHLVGDPNMEISNVRYRGSFESRAIFEDRDSLLPIGSGIVLTTGNVERIKGPNTSSRTSGMNGTRGYQYLTSMLGKMTYDAAILEFDFVAQNEVLRFNYVFASEEYPEYVGSPFNDIFAFALVDLETGEVSNLAVIPGTDLPITVNNINHKKFSVFYIDNNFRKRDSVNLEFDGMTKKLVAYHAIIPGRKYRIKLAIADAADEAYDSAVFIEGGSFGSQDKKSFLEENEAYFEIFLMEAKTTGIDIDEQSMLLERPLTTENEQTKPAHKIKTPSADNKAPEAVLDSVVIYFDFDSQVPTAKSLAEAGEKLQRQQIMPEKGIVIKGHTDSRGTRSYNKTLSLHRAEYVSGWLQRKFGYEKRKVEGWAYDRPVSHLDSESGFAKNRRVVVYYFRNP